MSIARAREAHTSRHPVTGGRWRHVNQVHPEPQGTRRERGTESTPHGTVAKHVPNLMTQITYSKDSENLNNCVLVKEITFLT